MNNNIVSFDAVSKKIAKLDNVSASKNIININLTTSSLKNQADNKGMFDGNLNINLSENKLKEYTLDELLEEGKTTQANVENQRKIETEKKEVEERKAKLEELEKLYDTREENNGFFHPKKEAKIEEQIKKLEAELNVPHKPDGWDKFCDIAKDAGATYVTLGASLYTGIIDVGETIVDGTVQACGGLISCGVGLINEEAGDAMKQGIQDFVSYDASGAIYDKFVEVSGIDEDIAYGWAHTAGTFTGQVVGYAAITVVTGGAGTVALSALAAAGSSAETAYANGATFDEALVASLASGTIGALAGGGMDKLGTVAKSANTLKGVIGYTGAGMAVGAVEPASNSLVEYATYGNDIYDSFGEYYKESGGILNTVMGIASGGLSAGGQALSVYKTNTKNIDLSDINQNYKINNQLDSLKEKIKLGDLDEWELERANARIYELKTIDKLSSDIANKLSLKTGENITSEQIKQFLSEPKGARPLPEEIFGNEYVKKHMDTYFSDGVVKCTSGTPPGLGGFFSSKSEIDKIIKTAYKNGEDIELALEKALDVKPGYFKNLTFSFPTDANGKIITDINKITDINGNGIKIPSGNERNAYSGLWEPGGFTKSGQPEVTIGTISDFKSISLEDYIEDYIGIRRKK